MVGVDDDWFAYQCKSGEVLFYYNVKSGEHRWAIHFCTCLKPKDHKAVNERCCIWEPIKSKPSESGKFVRSIGIQTDDSKDNTQETFIGHVQTVTQSPPAVTHQLAVQRSIVAMHQPVLLSPQAVSHQQVTQSGSEITDETETKNTLPEVITAFPSNPLPSLLPITHSDHVFHVDFELSKAAQEPSAALNNSNGEDSFAASSTRSHVVLLGDDTRAEHVSLDNNSAIIPSNGSLDMRRQAEGSSSRKKKEPRKIIKTSSTSAEYMEAEPRRMLRSGAEAEEDSIFTMSSPEHSTYDREVMGRDEPMVVIPNIPKIHMVQPEQKPVNFICQLCEAELPSAARLTEHIMRHQPSGSRCPICQRHFSRRVGLRFHVQAHSGDKPHQCHLCEKAFTKPATLVDHIRTHSSERPYVCSECNKGFTHPSNLTSHMKTHSDNRPFQCSDCDKGFKTSSHLARHQARSHGRAAVSLFALLKKV
ncbi:zinc finger and SCAN domain-containing protein 5A isoform X1 [Nematostella vectensis]|uniref:zinc finger and SCAN domain-containing protein 5A isoform X1 n=1 Tax=Nematostella vectensis TaxID=45351 RepID=UPI00207723D8|nr:zinc finger and SCAN domain-containing protein 5A isoform X1 [Nematostella vectensis]XP_048581603.1 zinc finger and SCAN domain-containing protein 5A isoform X1 [Nematostella vectensis]